VKTPPLWQQDQNGQIQRIRHAEHWHRDNGKIACDLCYRLCKLGDGESGWCGFRSARRGRMELDSHGIITSLVRQVRGYQVDPFLTYKPGMTSIFLGGQQCTAACTFCMSAQVVHKPGAVPWGGGRPQMLPGDSMLYAQRGLMHPRDAAAAALHNQARCILFGINEPLLSFEWTADVAQHAKRRGLDICIETNGFAELGPLRQLARFTDAVDVGTKGSLDDTFYTRVMRSPGAPDTVRRSLLAWRRVGVHLIVGDLIAPPHMQDDATFTEAAKRFYGWIAEHLGPLTDIITTPIFRPGPDREDGSPAATLTRTDAEHNHYAARLGAALELAHAAGLPYAHDKEPSRPIRCHQCGGILLRFTETCAAGREASGVRHLNRCEMARTYCPWWTHEQHVTGDSRWSLRNRGAGHLPQPRRPGAGAGQGRRRRRRRRTDAPGKPTERGTAAPGEVMGTAVTPLHGQPKPGRP